MGGSRGILAANQPLVVPMNLRLSNFKLSSYVVLVVSKQKGITLVFKTDPLQNVDINSTFDSIAVIQKYIQREIEDQLRQMFREDLPGIIHRLSQQWVKATFMPKNQTPKAHPSPPRGLSTMSNPEGLSSLPPRPYTSPNSPHFSNGYPVSIDHPFFSMPAPSRVGLRGPSRLRSDSASTTTAGDRETSWENTSQRGRFKGIANLHQNNRGLAHLAEDDETNDEFTGSYDFIDWDDTVLDAPPPSETSEEAIQYETIPAVGGGSITRPRIYHASSLMHAASNGRQSWTSDSYPSFPSQSMPPSPPQLSELRRSYATSDGVPLQRREIGVTPNRWSSHLPEDMSTTTGINSMRAQAERSMDARHANQSLQASMEAPRRSSRRPSVSSTAPSSAFLHDLHEPEGGSYFDMDEDSKIILRPGLNATISQLSLLNYSNHTLSPYTTALDHFAIRSVPPRILNHRGTPPERTPMKAKRKRTYRIGGPKQTTSTPENQALPKTQPSSEFDASDVDLYFRTDDESDQYRNDTPQIRRRPSTLRS